MAGRVMARYSMSLPSPVIGSEHRAHDVGGSEGHGERAEDLEQRVPVDQLEPSSQAAANQRDRARRDLDRDEELQQVLEELGERHRCLLTSDGSWQTMRTARAASAWAARLWPRGPGGSLERPHGRRP